MNDGVAFKDKYQPDELSRPDKVYSQGSADLHVDAKILDLK